MCTKFLAFQAIIIISVILIWNIHTNIGITTKTSVCSLDSCEIIILHEHIVIVDRIITAFIILYLHVALEVHRTAVERTIVNA